MLDRITGTWIFLIVSAVAVASPWILEWWWNRGKKEAVEREQNRITCYYRV
jgi:hypothetical protein